jgi:hypothetical protein
MAGGRLAAISALMPRRPVWLVATVFLALASPGIAADRYTNASVDAAGTLRIVTGDGRAIVLPKEPEQVDYDQIAISSDGRSVGWLARYPNGATSYPIPLKLMVYSAGKLHVYSGSELPVWRWRFTADGKQIAFEQETVHGGFGVHYELHEVVSGRLIAEYTPVVGMDNQPEPNQKPPQWVLELDAKR